MAVDDTTFKRLLDLGRQNGNRLGVEQLGQILPVDRLTPGEIAGLVERLDVEGVEVDLDEDWLKNRPKSGDYHRGDGAVAMAYPAAPAVSAPGARPSQHGWEPGDGDGGHGHGHGGHGSKVSPTWDRGGIDMIPVVSMVAVALVLIVGLAP